MCNGSLLFVFFLFLFGIMWIEVMCVKYLIGLVFLKFVGLNFDKFKRLWIVKGVVMFGEWSIVCLFWLLVVLMS